jgi:elongation factor P
MAEHVSTNQFKNGMHIDVEGTIYRIVEFQHVKPGKGGAFVRTKLKMFSTGAVVDRTFRAGEKFPRILTSVADMQFLYDDGTDMPFLNWFVETCSAMWERVAVQLCFGVRPLSKVDLGRLRSTSWALLRGLTPKQS